MKYIAKEAIKIESRQTLNLIKVLNINTFEEDDISLKILDELTVSIENHFPDFRLKIGPGNDVENDINLTGIYDRSGETINLKLRIFKGKEIWPQHEVEFNVEKNEKRPS